MTKLCKEEGCIEERVYPSSMCGSCRYQHHKKLPSQSWQARDPYKRSTRQAYWRMRRRCYNPIDPAYKDYGARGIKVCDRWLKGYKYFLEDMGLKPDKKLSLDRIDPLGDYGPENCRWADAATQSRNRRIQGKVRERGITQRPWGSYEVKIAVESKVIYIGSFKDKDDAISARLGAEASLWEN